jgi:acetyl esterase/lipase
MEKQLRNSAGGNMATVVAMMAKEKKNRLLNYKFYFTVTDSNETESYNLFAKDRFLTKI